MASKEEVEPAQQKAGSGSLPANGARSPVENAFSQKLGTSEKCLCCSQRTTVAIICSLMVLNAVYHFLFGVYMRWGRPCFIWWEHWATSITFVFSLGSRLVILPIAVLTLVELKNGASGVKYLRVLFHALVVLAVLLAIDVLLCIFEVSEVCESDAMDQYLACAHQWSLYAPDAAADPEWNNVTHTGARDTWVCPTVCSTWTPAGADSQYSGEASDAGADSYDFSGRCARDPTYRGELENRDDRVASCEVISILYDMALGAVLAALLFGFAYATNSYRALAEESGELAMVELEDGGPDDSAE